MSEMESPRRTPARELFVGVLLVLGFYPRLILDVIDPATRALIGALS